MNNSNTRSLNLGGRRHTATRGLAIAAIALMSATTVFSAFGIDWKPTAVGTYQWNDTANWTGGALPTATDEAKFPNNIATEGNQTINMPEGTVAGCLDVVNLASGQTGRTRTFTGSITTVSNNFRTGKTILKGRIDVTGSNQSFTRVGMASDFSRMGILEIADGGVFCATNDYAICVGRYSSDSSTEKAAGRLAVRSGGQLFLGGGGNVSMSGLMLGRADGNVVPGVFPFAVRRCSYFQDGGYALIRRFLAGVEPNVHAGMTIAGGVLELPWSEGTRYRVGHLGYGIFQQLGGEIYVNTNIVEVSTSDEAPALESFEIGSDKTLADGRLQSSAYLCGGTFVCGDVIAIQGVRSGLSSGAAPLADLTVDGDADVTTRNVRVGVNTGEGAAVLNLNGGRLSAIYIRRDVNGKNRTGANEVNANGGTLRIYHPTNPQSDFDFQFSGIDRILLYPKGLTVQSDVSTRIGAIAANCPLRTAKGYGVESVTIPSGATDWYEPPLVTIQGGSGSNATAVALIDYASNRLTNIVVTCRGEGYAADDALTIKLYKDQATAITSSKAEVTLSPNTPGTFVKTGTNRVVVAQQPYFDGTYEVREGLMLQTTSAACGSTNLAALVIGGTDACFQCGSGNTSANEAHWNPVNTNATLTLGTEYGPGKFWLPPGTDSKPFRQSFASLTVNGTGNVIEYVYPRNEGFKLSFGTISCAEGSEVTIPKWDTPYKVYVTGMPSGKCLKGVKFSGTEKYAMVGEDGQLIPAPTGMVLFVR